MHEIQVVASSDRREPISLHHCTLTVTVELIELSSIWICTCPDVGEVF